MQLIGVRANKETFRPVVFNETGLSFIVARQKDPESSEDGKTYNGVGKSLLARIINFCLGAKADNYKDFCEKLPGWEFYLDYKINVQKFTSLRKTDDPGKIYLNDVELSIQKFNDKMEELCFTLPEDITYLSFRSLIAFFLRPFKESYVNCMEPTKSGKEYQTLLNNTFLLGLDIKLAEKKYLLRKEQEKIQKMEKLFEDDSMLYDFMSGNKDVKLEIENISDQLKKIEEDLRRFKLAEDYHDIQTEADSVETVLYELNNEIILIQNNINNIEKSLSIKISSNMTIIDLERVYNEAKVNFSDSVKKTLQEVDTFYKDLLINRNKRLSEQKNLFIFAITEKKHQKEQLQKKFDHLISYLGEHQALDVFIALNQKKSELIDERNKLSRFQAMQTEYKTRERQTKIEFIELSKITEDYLSEIEDGTRIIRNLFRDLAKQFYPNNASGITINVHEGENQLAFTIDPKIDSDASDGINNVKLFCYDLTILFEGQNHHVKFVFHDSRLFDSIDERQLAIMFQVLQNLFTTSEKQYIATINQNQLNNLQKTLLPVDYEKIITKNTVLTLTDDSDAEKLLGIRVDIGNK
ncbi:hypothetical protein FACS189483_05570 [Spirochaetia bacterium]|nr:hypothetical protein FACS189483_05570 [Spirochaetia bacterium]